MKISTSAICEKIDDLYRRSDRPVLVGQASIATGLSLKDAESRLEDLVADGLLRRATPAECHEFDLCQGYVPIKR